MVGAGEELRGASLAGVSVGGGVGESILTDGVAGAACVSVVFAQPANAIVVSRIAKPINHEGHEAPRRLSEQTPFVSFCVFVG